MGDVAAQGGEARGGVGGGLGAELDLPARFDGQAAAAGRRPDEGLKVAQGVGIDGLRGVDIPAAEATPMQRCD